jgi:hypothetical protein
MFMRGSGLLPLQQGIDTHYFTLFLFSEETGQINDKRTPFPRFAPDVNVAPMGDHPLVRNPQAKAHLTDLLLR